MPQTAYINVKRLAFVTDLLSIGLCVSVLGVAMSVLVMVRAKQADLGSSASDRLRSVVRGGRSQGYQGDEDNLWGTSQCTVRRRAKSAIGDYWWLSGGATGEVCEHYSMKLHILMHGSTYLISLILALILCQGFEQLELIGM